MRRLTFDMSGGPKGAKRPLERPLDGGVRRQRSAHCDDELAACATPCGRQRCSRVHGACNTVTRRSILGLAQKRSLPERISHHRRQSPMRLNPGYLNAAGLLCSKKKWPTQAKA